MKKQQYKTKRIDQENCLYRGKLIELFPMVAQSYVGRYRVGRKGLFCNQKEAKLYIDRLCEEQGIESFMTEEQVKEYISDF